jgi:hypothetical protein
MKAMKLFAGFSSYLVVALSAHAQVAFNNLNFEQANPTNAGNREYPDNVTLASALPYWTGSLGGNPVTQVTLNNYDLGDANIDIFGPGWNEVGPGIIDGNYTLMLQAGANQGTSPAVNASISQDGTIPADAKSLEFDAVSMLTGATLSVSFDGNSLSPVVVSGGQGPSGQGYQVFGAEVLRGL